MIKLVRACDEERKKHTEESVDDGYSREKEERTTENKMEELENYCTENGRKAMASREGRQVRQSLRARE